MQGTLVMLVALSGLGCHNRGCEIAYAPPTYSSCFGVGYGCYADWYPGPVTPACYAGCYGGCYSGCYGGCFGGGCYAGCYGGCYGGGCYGNWYGGCYGGKHHGCGGGGLFSCFHRKRCNYCNSGYAYGGPGLYGSGYSPAIFGSALGMPYGAITGTPTLMGSGETLGRPITPGQPAGSTMGMGVTNAGTPSEVVAPVAPRSATPGTATPGVVPPATDTTPPPPPPGPAGAPVPPATTRPGNPPTT